jgi:mannosyl-3-phosphoglycerate phosphatase
MTPPSGRHLIFTDLDGTFLEEASYSFERSLPVLREALAAGHIVVFCSSKTAAEIENLQNELQIRMPFVAENGGGIFIPAGTPGSKAGSPEGDWAVITLGSPYSLLVQALEQVRRETGTRIRGFSHMSAEEVAGECGLDLSKASLAKRRRFDEPFKIALEDAHRAQAVAEAIARRGLNFTRGGRFCHITGGSDKGRAVRVLTGLLRSEYPAIRTAGIGDSANDLPMLEAVERPFLVQRPDGTYENAVFTRVTGLTCVPAPGAAGWARAIALL